MTKCPCCEGTGKQVIEAQEMTDKGMKKLPSVAITCIFCNGKKKVTAKQLRDYEASVNAWCNCGNPSRETSFWRLPDGSHGYDCIDCGKILQTG